MSSDVAGTCAALTSVVRRGRARADKPVNLDPGARSAGDVAHALRTPFLRI